MPQGEGVKDTRYVAGDSGFAVLGILDDTPRWLGMLHRAGRCYHGEETGVLGVFDTTSSSVEGSREGTICLMGALSRYAF